MKHECYTSTMQFWHLCYKIFSLNSKCWLTLQTRIKNVLIKSYKSIELSFLFAVLLLLLFVSLTIASPSGNEREPPLYENIVGQASNIIASTILKANIDINKNYVFSPIGYTTLLAILGEGAKDDAHKDIGLLLQHPVEERIGLH